MAYSLTTSDGSVVINIPDGQFDTSTSLTLPGPNTVGYGQFLDQNLLTLLESFASNTAPSGGNLQGQLWFNKGTQTLQVFTDQGYTPVAGVVVSFTQPTGARIGDRWFNTNTGQFYLYDGTTWNLIGPTYTKVQGLSGAIPTTIGDLDVLGATHNVLKLQYGSVTMAMISAEPAPFHPSPAIPGFPEISPGITFNDTITLPTINASITGNVTGNVAGNLVGTSVTATDLYGNLTGDVTGSVTGFFVGNATGNISGIFNGTSVTATTGRISNFTSSNAQVTSGNVTGLTTLTATNGAITNLTASNITVTGGNLSGILSVVSVNQDSASVTTNTLQVNTSANVGSITSLSATTGSAVITTGNVVNLVSSNARITNGTANLSSVTATTATATTATIDTATAATVFVGNLFSSNANIQTGNIVNLTSSNVRAASIGNTGAQLTGTIATASQPNITGVGTITTGAWQGNVVSPTYGGTGINNGTNTLSVTGNFSINQNVAVGASPTFVATNFSGTAANLTAGAAGNAVTANTLTTGNFTISQSGAKLIIKWNNTPIFSIDSNGNMIAAQNITGFGTP